MAAGQPTGLPCGTLNCLLHLDENEATADAVNIPVTDFESADCSSGDQQQQPQTHDTAEAATTGQMQHTGGYDSLGYYQQSPPMYMVAPQHQRATWARYQGPSFRSSGHPGDCVSEAPPFSVYRVPPHNGGTAANLGAGPSTSVAAAAAGSDGTLHAALGDVTAAAAGAGVDNSDIMGVARMASMGQMQHMVGPYYMPFNRREDHNAKERKRRSRIKNACQDLRSLVPGLTEKTDKATVFEFTVQYLLHLRRHLGSKRDKSISKEVMEKYSPY
ncbi:hypothetical protein V5799_015179 [Amblyomma americanum]|uniref:BHLH domain-containing protein n=1 Tax=Amblyomma americanum TaxID=6943 RepID=A0AAQ4E0W6_AMBAM